MESIWTQTCEIPARKALPGDEKTEVAVIGAGMAGLLIADALANAGYRVTVLEADRIAGGQTRNTTAKITSQHGPSYRQRLQTLGLEKAKQYAAANEAALAEYRRLILKRGIDCELEEQEACVYGMDPQALRAEAEAAAKLGLPASFREQTGLPFPTAGAVCFAHQAQFHPLKFLKAIAEPLNIYEKTPVKRVQDHRLVTDLGTVTADKIVFACHYPFVNFPGMFFARMHQERSYVLALENAGIPDGMWIGSGKEPFSLRHYGDLVLLGGGDHRCGDNRKGGRYEILRLRAREWFPNSRERAHWSAQDCVTADGVPYIGKYAESRPDWYVATGFQKWGMTGSMVSAMLLRDAICGGENPYADAFAPSRFNAETAAGVAGETGHAIKGLTKHFFQIPWEQAKDIPPDHGGIVFFRGKKLGVYKDTDGKLYPVSVFCPHLGCQLEWNPDERSWDCLCHGSRFDRFGNRISGPAETSTSPAHKN